MLLIKMYIRIYLTTLSIGALRLVLFMFAGIMQISIAGAISIPDGTKNILHRSDLKTGFLNLYSMPHSDLCDRKFADTQ